MISKLQVALTGEKSACVQIVQTGQLRSFEAF